MKTLETLFDTEIAKETKEKTPAQILSKELKKSINQSIYKYKIHFNRVYYGKVESFPIGITKDIWLELATDVWNNKLVTVIIDRIKVPTPLPEVMKLVDVSKANQ